MLLRGFCDYHSDATLFYGSAVGDALGTGRRTFQFDTVYMSLQLKYLFLERRQALSLQRTEATEAPFQRAPGLASGVRVARLKHPAACDIQKQGYHRVLQEQHYGGYETQEGERSSNLLLHCLKNSGGTERQDEKRHACIHINNLFP